MLSWPEKSQHTPLVIGVGEAGCAAVRQIMEQWREGIQYICVNAGQDGTFGQEAAVLHAGTGGDQDAVKKCLATISSAVNPNTHPAFIVFSHDDAADSGLAKQIITLQPNAAWKPIVLASIPCGGSAASLRHASDEVMELRAQFGNAALVLPVEQSEKSCSTLAQALNLLLKAAMPGLLSMDVDPLCIARASDGLSIICESKPFAGEVRAAKAVEAVLDEARQKLRQFGCGACRVLVINVSASYLTMQEYAEVSGAAEAFLSNDSGIARYVSCTMHDVGGALSATLLAGGAAQTSWP